MTRPLLVATRNPGKAKEFAELLRGLDINWLSPDEAGAHLTVPETGQTLEANAVLKATAYAAVTGLLTLADDSGLEVDALDGRPGVHTARFGGEGMTPAERYELLLRKLEGVPWEKRSARFRCVVALAKPDGLIGTVSGKCEGVIAWNPAGSAGFGYDPIFYLPSKKMTMAQLAPAEKHRISHRGRAVAEIAPLLRSVLEGERK